MVRTVQTLLAAALLSACSSTPVVLAPYPPRYDAPYPPQYDVHSPYAFEYAVRDRYTGAAFSQAEQSSGAAVRGSYSVALPDGRIQHVTYVADHSGDGGYNAHVTYEGAAHHPAPLYGYRAPYQPQPAPYQPQPAPYQPEPEIYQPEPEVYQPEPEVYQPEPEVYQTEPEVYQTEPEVYQTEPEVYQPEPEVYQAEPDSYQLPLEPHKP
ncbi:cuticle protein 19-like [Amphibalanus amphitrite]|uniref:cuticle protein 19-like n=1 Tax=Amphibalanus amphitrite TaxID=1232801 RepID=UPI001C905A1D|nr:cuticle protein 19-like [Amphibalanus amphitrite]